MKCVVVVSAIAGVALSISKIKGGKIRSTQPWNFTSSPLGSIAVRGSCKNRRNNSPNGVGDVQNSRVPSNDASSDTPIDIVRVENFIDGRRFFRVSCR
jgi:hypothetical protein